MGLRKKICGLLPNAPSSPNTPIPTKGQTTNSQRSANISFRNDNLWLEAHDKLSDEDRETVNRFIPKDAPYNFRPKDIAKALQDKGRIFEENR